MKVKEHTIKRMLAAAMAAACIISGTQLSGTVARAETAASADGVTEEGLAKGIQWKIDYEIESELQYLLEDEKNSTPEIHYCNIPASIEHPTNENVKDHVPGEYYFPTKALWLHIGSDGQNALYACDGTYKYPMEYKHLIEEGENRADDKYLYFVSDGITAKIVTHPDQEVEYASGYLFAGDEEIVIPDPPKPSKIEMSEDGGSFYYSADSSSDGYVTGKDTTYISHETVGEGDRISKLVIRSTKVTNIPKNVFKGMYPERLKKGVKIYLPKSKFKKYKAMLLKSRDLKKAKPKFYTLDKWDGKIGSDMTWIKEEGWKETIKADRTEALKGTDQEGNKKIINRYIYQPD